MYALGRTNIDNRAAARILRGEKLQKVALSRAISRGTPFPQPPSGFKISPRESKSLSEGLLSFLLVGDVVTNVAAVVHNPAHNEVRRENQTEVSFSPQPTCSPPTNHQPFGDDYPSITTSKKRWVDDWCGWCTPLVSSSNSNVLWITVFLKSVSVVFKYQRTMDSPY